MGLIEAWLNTAVREGFADGRPLADIAEETGLSESEVLCREVELKLIPQLRQSYQMPWRTAARRCACQHALLGNRRKRIESGVADSFSTRCEREYATTLHHSRRCIGFWG